GILTRTPRDTFLTAEPMAQSFAGRARRELRAGRSIVGGMLTAVHRNLDDDVSLATLRSDALAGGVDFRHEFWNRAWLIRGDAEASRIAGTSASILAEIGRASCRERGVICEVRTELRTKRTR